MTYDAVVIGAGISGLTAALLLARQGQRVALVEQAGRVAPLLRRFRRGGVWCDGGFHYSGGLGPGETIDVLLRHLGLTVEAVPMNPAGFDVIEMPGEPSLSVPNGLEAVRAALCERFPQSRPAVEAYVARVEEVLRSTPFLNFDLNITEATRGKFAAQSLGEFLATHGAEPALARLLGDYGYALCGAGRDELPMDYHAMVMGPFYRSAHTLRRGGDSLVQAFEGGLGAAGVEVFCGRRVTGIRLDERRSVRAVELDGGERLECHTCISTIHPQRLGALFAGEAFQPRLLGAVQDRENTFSPFTMFLDWERLPERLSQSNHYRFLDPGLDSPAAETDDFIALLSCAAEADEDKPAFCAFAPCPTDELAALSGRREAYQDFKHRQTEQMLERTFDFFPDLRGQVRVAEVATPLTYEALTGTTGGAVYGLRHSTRHKPLQPHSGVGGLYLAGQSVLLSGVMGAMISGYLAVAHIEDIQTIWNEIQQCR